MAADDITLKVLIEIRDELRSHSNRIDQTNARLDVTNVRLEQVGQRIVESELRTATAITELAGTVQGVRGLLEKRLDLRDRVEQCEREIAELKRRVG